MYGSYGCLTVRYAITLLFHKTRGFKKILVRDFEFYHPRSPRVKSIFAPGLSTYDFVLVFDSGYMVISICQHLDVMAA